MSMKCLRPRLCLHAHAVPKPQNTAVVCAYYFTGLWKLVQNQADVSWYPCRIQQPIHAKAFWDFSARLADADQTEDVLNCVHTAWPSVKGRKNLWSNFTLKEFRVVASALDSFHTFSLCCLGSEGWIWGNKKNKCSLFVSKTRIQTIPMKSGTCRNVGRQFLTQRRPCYRC